MQNVLNAVPLSGVITNSPPLGEWSGAQLMVTRLAWADANARATRATIANRYFFIMLIFSYAINIAQVANPVKCYHNFIFHLFFSSSFVGVTFLVEGKYCVSRLSGLFLFAIFLQSLFAIAIEQLIQIRLGLDFAHPNTATGLRLPRRERWRAILGSTCCPWTSHAATCSSRICETNQS